MTEEKFYFLTLPLPYFAVPLTLIPLGRVVKEEKPRVSFLKDFARNSRDVREERKVVYYYYYYFFFP